MLEVCFSDRALDQLSEAYRHYLAVSPIVADRFEQALAQAKSRLAEWPDSGRPIEQGPIRKLRLAQYPFALLYEVHAGNVYILRTIDLRSDPTRWMD